jgi:hypothetical protein
MVLGNGGSGFVVGLLPHGGLGLYFDTSEYDWFLHVVQFILPHPRIFDGCS